MKCGCKEKLNKTPFCPTKKTLVDYIKEWVAEMKEWKTWVEGMFEILAAASGFDPAPLESDLANKADKVATATENNFASFDSEGNIKDSGKKAADFAPFVHHHSTIGINTLQSQSEINVYDYGDITIFADGPSTGSLTISIGDGGTLMKSATITTSNMDNLNRALQDPDTTPTVDSDKLVTSGGVYTALQSKASASSVSTLTSDVNRISTLLDEVVRRTDEDAFENLVPGGNGNWQITGKVNLHSGTNDTVIVIDGNLPSVGDIVYITSGTNPSPNYTDNGITATVLETSAAPNRIHLSQDVSSIISTTIPPYNNIFIWLPTA